MKISVILPVINEELCIKSSLNSLQDLRQRGHEVIVADGGSKDNSRELAIHLVDKLLVSEPGRAKQMNFGANNASGDILLFLHADTIVPRDIDNTLIDTLTSDIGWGRFDIQLSGENWIFRIIERLINIRSRLSGIATGDQGIFITTKLFKLIHGYPDIPLMEDVAISHKLKNHSKPICIKQNILASSRRWEEKGVIRTILLMWKLRIQYRLGVNPDKLAKLYD